MKSARFFPSTLVAAFCGVAASVAMAPAARADATQAAYQSVAKSLYVWNPGGASSAWAAWTTNGSDDRLVGFCKVHGFARVNVFVGAVQYEWATSFSQGHLPYEAALVDLARKLRAAGIAPVAAFYLNDDPNDFTNAGEAADVVSAVLQFNRTYPDAAWVGLEGDAEPDAPGAAYLALNRGMLARKAALGATFPIGASLRPKWLPLPSTSTFASAFSDALASLDTGMIMAYNDTEATSRSFGIQGLTLAQSLGKPLHVAIETRDLGAPNTDSFHDMVVAADKTPFFQMVVRLHQEYSTYSTYAGFEIHDYAGYFVDLYGVTPDVYPGTSFTTLYAGGAPIAPLSWGPIAAGVPDAGGDANPSDAGAPDEGVAPDTDAAASDASAALSNDAASNTAASSAPDAPPPTSACACSVIGARREAPTPIAALLFGVLVLLAPRRSRGRRWVDRLGTGKERSRGSRRTCPARSRAAARR